MHSITAALAVCAALAPGADLRFFEDAALHAIRFVDREEGWAVGDQGVIWHTIDGGKSWERQPSGVRASLRAIHFLNPYTGWAVGREELPGGGSGGVLLVTRDGGLKWQRVAANRMPGLHGVRFFDDRQGIVFGSGSDQFPTGVFRTADGGRSWQPIPGPRCPAWLAADFADPTTGVLAGAWNRLATWRDSQFTAADVDPLGGRGLRGLQLSGRNAIAVGQGGLVLLSTSGGARWGFADLGLSPDLLATCDFHAVHVLGDDIRIVGRPGSVLLHSADAGKTWKLEATGQQLPLHHVFFVDDNLGWAVGELGTILGTRDGGKTWTVQQRGGSRAAALFVHARAVGLPLDTVAQLGGEDGYLAAALRCTCADPESAAPMHAGDGDTWSAAMRQVGGAAGETLWQFPLPQHLAAADKALLLQAWNRRHGDRAAEELLRQLVLAVRMWRPEIVVTDPPDPRLGATAAEAILAEAICKAANLASDETAFPEQLAQLGLKPCGVAKVYARWPAATGAAVTINLNEPRSALAATLRDFAGPATALLTGGNPVLPASRHYGYLAGDMANGRGHNDLMQGIVLAYEGTARRKLTSLTDPDPEIIRQIQYRRTIQALAEEPLTGLADPDRLLAHLGPALDKLPDDQAGAAAFTVASHFARQGQWVLARETFLLMVDRYPAHPQSIDAFRWLVRYSSSSEARRRQELGQFLAVTHIELRQAGGDGIVPVSQNRAESVRNRQTTILGSLVDARQWYGGSLALQDRVAAFGPLYVSDPAVQFCWQSARRNLGEFDTAQKWLEHFRTQPASDLWRTAAQAEQWLVNRAGPPPRPVLPCRQAIRRPYLDGRFDDDCWQGLAPVPLRNAAGDTSKDNATEVRLAFDNDFLYVALRCQHPASQHVEPARGRPRDADLHAFDRVSLLLDLDRDYSTYYHLQVDQRGWVWDDCWGDRRWDPRWFVAVHNEPAAWQVEAAIPLAELTGDSVTPGRAWAANVVRVLPGQGVQAVSLPADVDPRPEGLGLLLFVGETRRPSAQP